MRQDNMVSLQEIFIRNLKFYRKKQGLSQEALSEKLNKGTNYINKIESRASFPTVQVIEQIAQTLEIKASWLFEEKGSPINSIKFNTEDFVRQIADELYDRVSAAVISYFEQKLGRG